MSPGSATSLPDRRPPASRSLTDVTAPDLDPQQPLSPAVVSTIGDRIAGFLAQQQEGVDRVASWLPDARAADTGTGLPGPATGLDLVRDLASTATSGGKRMRPAFALWGCVAAGGPDSVTEPVWTATAALDLLHVSALVHDDVMDDSDLRRGQPAAHKQFEAFHSAHGWSGNGAEFGRAGAILLGDLLVMWSAEMVDTAGVDPVALARALPVLHAMRTEVTLGQFLDVMAQHEPLATETARAVVNAERVVEHKSAKYTVQRPLLFGAALAGAAPEVVEALAVYGSAIGRAFQYRDDLLGVFGDEQLTGKPAGDDLREGKRTLLVAHTRERLGGADRHRFDALFGRADLDAAGRDELRELISGSGAETDVEAMITALHAGAIAALDPAPVSREGRTALQVLADVATRREF